MSNLINVDQDYVEIFETEVRKVIQRNLDRRTSVFIDPKRDIDSLRYDGVRFSPKYNDLWTLCALLQFSDYFGEFREYIIYEVQKYLENRCIFPELSASLSGRSICSLVLLTYTNKRPREVFGNLLSERQINRVLDLVRLILIRPIKPKKTIRRRGYKDKGSLRPTNRWLPSSDWSLDDLQYKIEKQREEYHASVSFIVRTCGDWVLKNRISTKGGCPNEPRRQNCNPSVQIEEGNQRTGSTSEKRQNYPKVQRNSGQNLTDRNKDRTSPERER